MTKLIPVTVAALVLTFPLLADAQHRGTHHERPSTGGTETTTTATTTTGTTTTATTTTTTTTSTTIGRTPLLVPAYWAPPFTFCTELPTDSIVIANPDSGDTSTAAPGYAEAVEDCGAKVIGYVYTEYGKRSLSTVESQIADYYSHYPGIAGIFLDQMAEEPDESYYATLESDVHSRGGIVVGNPGDVASTGWQLDVVDVVVDFEGSASEYRSYKSPSWALPGREANIVFDASTLSCPSASYVYETNETAPNPYASLPSYWSSEASRC
jgi:Spherulation-specific family 4